MRKQLREAVSHIDWRTIPNDAAGLAHKARELLQDPRIAQTLNAAADAALALDDLVKALAEHRRKNKPDNP